MPTRPVVWMSRLATPGAGAFSILFGFEAMARALVTSALPIQTLRLMGSDEDVSLLYFVGSASALSMIFLIPRLAEWMGRARLCSLALVMIAAAMILFTMQAVPSQVAGFVLRASGIAILYAGLSMFIMDRIKRNDIGRSEPLRMLSVGISWTVGPIIGVLLNEHAGDWAPFAGSALMMALAFIYFWTLRVRDLPIVRSAKRRQQRNPFANMGVYLRQPRLRLALVHAIGRGMFWNCLIFYSPLWASSRGHDPALGGYIVSAGSAFLLGVPLWGWFARRYGIRRVSLFAFPVAAIGTLLSTLPFASPWTGAACLVMAAFAMTIIDGYGNALFLRACKPSQRTEMTPIFSAQRDIGDVSHAAFFSVVLIFFPIDAVFITVGVVLTGLTVLSTRINARL